jgi:hypothetical protein
MLINRSTTELGFEPFSMIFAYAFSAIVDFGYDRLSLISH